MQPVATCRQSPYLHKPAVVKLLSLIYSFQLRSAFRATTTPSQPGPLPSLTFLNSSVVLITVNGIFAKIGRLASEEVFLQLIRQKCMPILLYGLDVCSLSKRNIQSLDFTVNRVLMKLFKTSNTDIINNCRDMFDIKLPSVQLSQRFDAFMAKWI